MATREGGNIWRGLEEPRKPAGEQPLGGARMTAKKNGQAIPPCGGKQKRERLDSETQRANTKRDVRMMISSIRRARLTPSDAVKAVEDDDLLSRDAHCTRQSFSCNFRDAARLVVDSPRAVSIDERTTAVGPVIMASR